MVRIINRFEDCRGRLKELLINFLSLSLLFLSRHNLASVLTERRLRKLLFERRRPAFDWARSSTRREWMERWSRWVAVINSSKLSDRQEEENWLCVSVLASVCEVITSPWNYLADEITTLIWLLLPQLFNFLFLFSIFFSIVGGHLRGQHLYADAKRSRLSQSGHQVCAWVYRRQDQRDVHCEWRLLSACLQAAGRLRRWWMRGDNERWSLVSLLKWSLLLIFKKIHLNNNNCNNNFCIITQKKCNSSDCKQGEQW